MGGTFIGRLKGLVPGQFPATVSVARHPAEAENRSRCRNRAWGNCACRLVGIRRHKCWSEDSVFGASRSRGQQFAVVLDAKPIVFRWLNVTRRHGQVRTDGVDCLTTAMNVHGNVTTRRILRCTPSRTTHPSPQCDYRRTRGDRIGASLRPRHGIDPPLPTHRP
jgi:hypothetical protein